MVLQEAGDEEKKEVSTALANLRKKYDVIKLDVNDKEDELQLLEKDMKRAEGEEKAVSKDFGGGKQEEEQAEAELSYVCEMHDF